MGEQTPDVGVGVIIPNGRGEILLGKRLSPHAPFWALPGGKMALGETFEQTASREIYEETGLELSPCQVVSITNNLQTFAQEGLHFISIILLAQVGDYHPYAAEPEKCAQWHWFKPDALPHPLFEASAQGIHNWRCGQFYQSHTPH